MGQILENEPKSFDIFRHADLWVMVSTKTGRCGGATFISRSCPPPGRPIWGCRAKTLRAPRNFRTIPYQSVKGMRWPCDVNSLPPITCGQWRSTVCVTEEKGLASD